jgi:hypothetical protein
MKRKIVSIRLEPKIVAITWKQCNEAEVWETCSLKSVEHPTPTFKKAMQALLPTALRLLDLPAGYGSGCSVRHVQFDEIGDEAAFAVQVVKRLGDGEGERLVAIRTPMTMAVAGSAVRCTEKDIDLAADLQMQAAAYLDGKRDADDLFAGKAGTGGSVEMMPGKAGEGEGDQPEGKKQEGKADLPTSAKKGKKAATSAKKPPKLGK